ncbi:MAG TPA: TIGR03435 family protein [Candidatus Aquilonibacter sp.]|nr:TIGR03435 family protein [Candidatus Aquilonibacter sp.]
MGSEHSAAGKDRPMKCLAAWAVALVVAVFIAGIFFIPRAIGQASQAAAAAPSFEVASIKRHTGVGGMVFLDGGDPGRYTSSNITAKMLVEFAYGIQDFQLSGGPGWIDSERFDIDAKIDETTANKLRPLSYDQQQKLKSMMLQSLLADRFALKVTREPKELPVYALVMAKSGSKLTEVAPPGPPDKSRWALPAQGSGPPSLPPGARRMSIKNGVCTIEGNAEPLSQLTDMLSMQTGRMVLDQTGLKANYDFDLQFAVDSGPGGMPLPPGALGSGSETAPSLFSAVQEQLGLRLESTKAPVDTITIDQIEEPTAN